MIKWNCVVDAVYARLIERGVKLADAYVGDFEFGGLDSTEVVLVNACPKTGVVVIVDAAHWVGEGLPSVEGVVRVVRWVDFVTHIEGLCLSEGVMPSEALVDHLEFRPKSTDDYSVHVDSTFKTLSITDSECRINGSGLAGLLRSE